MNFNKEIVERPVGKPVAEISCKAPKGFPTIPVIHSSSKTSFKNRNIVDNGSSAALPSAVKPVSVRSSTAPSVSRVNADVGPPDVASPVEDDYEKANTDLVQSMSSEEVEAALASYASVISPENLAFLRSRSQRPPTSGASVITDTSSQGISNDTPIPPPAVRKTPVLLPPKPSRASDFYKSKSNRFDMEGRRVFPSGSGTATAESAVATASASASSLREELYGDLFQSPAAEATPGRKPGHQLMATLMREAPANEQALVASTFAAWDERIQSEFMEILMRVVDPWVTVGEVLDLEAEGGGRRTVRCSAELELYNHERDPHLPGFTFEDICEWCRSLAGSQRAVALRILTGLLWRRDFITSLEAYCDASEASSGMEADGAVSLGCLLRGVDSRAAAEMTALQSGVRTLVRFALGAPSGAGLSERRCGRFILRALAKCACASDLPVELPTLLMWSIGQVSPRTEGGSRQWPLLSRIAVLQCFKQYVACSLEEEAAALIGRGKGCLQVLGSPRLPVGPHNLRSTAQGYTQAMLEAQEKRRGVLQTAAERKSASADGQQGRAGAASASMLDDVAFKCRHGRIDSILQFSGVLDCLDAVLGDALDVVSSSSGGKPSAAPSTASEAARVRLVLQNSIQRTAFESGLLALEILCVCVRNCEEESSAITDSEEPAITNNISEHLFVHILQKHWARVEPLIVSVAKEGDELLGKFTEQWWRFSTECCRHCPASAGHTEWSLRHIYPFCLRAAAAEAGSAGKSTDAPALRLLQTLVAQVRHFGAAVNHSTREHDAELTHLVDLVVTPTMVGLVDVAADGGPARPALVYLVEQILLLLNSYVMRLVRCEGNSLATVVEEGREVPCCAAWCRVSGVGLGMCAQILAGLPDAAGLQDCVAAFLRGDERGAVLSVPGLHLCGTALGCSSRSDRRTQAETIERVTCARSSVSVLDAAFALRHSVTTETALSHLDAQVTNVLNTAPILRDSSSAVAAAIACMDALNDRTVVEIATASVAGQERIYALLRFVQAIVTSNVTLPLPLDGLRRLAGASAAVLSLVGGSNAGGRVSVGDGLFAHQQRLLVQLSSLQLVGVVNACGVLCAVGGDTDGYADSSLLLRRGAAFVLPMLTPQFAFAFTALSRVVLQELLARDTQVVLDFGTLHGTLCSSLVEPATFLVSRCHTGGDLRRDPSALLEQEAADQEEASAETGRSLACWVNSCGMDPAVASAATPALPTPRAWLFDALLLLRGDPGTGATVGPTGTPQIPVFVTWLGALRTMLLAPTESGSTATAPVLTAPWFDQMYPLLAITTKEYGAYWEELDDFGFVAESMEPLARCELFRPFASVDEMVYRCHTDTLLEVFSSECLRVSAAGVTGAVSPCALTVQSEPSNGWKLLQEASCEELVAHLLDATFNQDVDVVVKETYEGGIGAPWCNFSNIHSCTLLVFFSDALFSSQSSQFYWKIRCSIWRRASELRLLHLLENQMLHAGRGVILHMLPMHWWQDVLRGGNADSVPSALSRSASASACALARVVLASLVSLRAPERDRALAIYRYGLFLVAYAIVTPPLEESGVDTAGDCSCVVRGARGRLLIALLRDEVGVETGAQDGGIADQLVADVLAMCNCLRVRMPAVIRDTLTAGVSRPSVGLASDQIVALWSATLSASDCSTPLGDLTGASVQNIRSKAASTNAAGGTDLVSFKALLEQHRPALASLCK